MVSVGAGSYRWADDLAAHMDDDEATRRGCCCANNSDSGQNYNRRPRRWNACTGN